MIKTLFTPKKTTIQKLFQKAINLTFLKKIYEKATFLIPLFAVSLFILTIWNMVCQKEKESQVFKAAKNSPDKAGDSEISNQYKHLNSLILINKKP